MLSLPGIPVEDFLVFAPPAFVFGVVIDVCACGRVSACVQKCMRRFVKAHVIQRRTRQHSSTTFMHSRMCARASTHTPRSTYASFCCRQRKLRGPVFGLCTVLAASQYMRVYAHNNCTSSQALLHTHDTQDCTQAHTMTRLATRT